jgi:hypothetical protein
MTSNFVFLSNNYSNRANLNPFKILIFFLAYNFHDENNEHLGLLNVQAGSDATSAFWHDLDSQLPLFASHADFLKRVAYFHNAHW